MTTETKDVEREGELPVAIWSGSFRLFGVEVKCHTLSDGRRIVEAESMHALMEVMAGDNGADGINDGTLPLQTDDITAFAKWRAGV